MMTSLDFYLTFFILCISFSFLLLVKCHACFFLFFFYPPADRFKKNCNPLNLDLLRSQNTDFSRWFSVSGRRWDCWGTGKGGRFVLSVIVPFSRK